MYCGIILNGDTEEDSSVAFLDDGATETFSVSTNDDILALLEQRRPEVIAMNAPPQRTERAAFEEAADVDSELDDEISSQFRSGEEELIEEGHAVLPQGMRDKAVLERADHLARSIEAMGFGATIIESHAAIAAQVLGLEGDEAMQEQEIETDGIETVWEYDAVVLAIVAKLYADNQCEDHGIVVPENGVESI